MPLHVFRPLRQGSYECTFTRRNQITIPSINEITALAINNVFLNPYIWSPAHSGYSNKFPSANFKYMTFGTLTVKISHIVPICINTIGTTATDLAQFQITPYLLGGIFSEGQNNSITINATYNESNLLANNVIETTSPAGNALLQADKLFTLSAGQTYTYTKDIPNPPGRFYWQVPKDYTTNEYYLPADIPLYNTANISPNMQSFVSKANLYHSIPQSPDYPIIALAMQWFDILNASTNKPRLQASAMIESELQITFYTDSDQRVTNSANYSIPLVSNTWAKILAQSQYRPNFYRK